MRLDSKVAIITGASRGIGKAIALKLAQHGAGVLVNYNNGEEKALEVVQEIKAFGGTAFSYKANVSKREEVEKLFQYAVKEFGKVEILVNNAGITKDNLLIRMNEEDWDDVIDINLKGVFNCTKEAAKMMIKNRKGKIINISSIVGIRGNAGQSNYSAAKAGIIGFSKSVAKELSSRNINVNVIAPGFIATEMTDRLTDNLKEKILSGIPLARFGAVEEIASATLFLASDLSDYITGQVLSVDGGMSI